MSAINFSRKLNVLGHKNGFNGFMQKSIILGAIAFIVALYAGLFLLRSERAIVFALPVFFLPLVLNYFFTLYEFDARKKAVEDEVPNLLLIASSMPEKTSMKKLVEFMAEHGEGPIAEEFSIVAERVSANEPVEKALESLKRRNESLSLNRAVDLLVNSIKTGAPMNSVFRETAEDFMETNAILRERGASSAIEKYTLLLAGGIIVPLILGLLAGMIGNFEFTAISELGIGLSESARKELVEASLLGSIIYIAEYALIASVFVAFQEASQKKAVLYASVLLPLGLIVYFIGKGF